MDDPQRQSAVVATKEKEHSSSKNSLQFYQLESHDVDHRPRPRMSFEPSVENQHSLGLGSYMLAGVGVAMGVTLVGAIFGAIG